jgi:hypothetical protein
MAARPVGLPSATSCSAPSRPCSATSGSGERTRGQTSATSTTVLPSTRRAWHTASCPSCGRIHNAAETVYRGLDADPETGQEKDKKRRRGQQKDKI